MVRWHVTRVTHTSQASAIDVYKVRTELRTCRLHVRIDRFPDDLSSYGVRVLPVYDWAPIAFSGIRLLLDLYRI